MNDYLAIALAVLLLALNAFFVGAEFALVSARRTSLEPKAAAGSRRAKVALAAMERVSLMMAGAQLGITVCSLGLGSIGEPAVAHLIERPLEAMGVPSALLHPIAFAIAMSIVVFLHVVIGEMVPKNLALARPDVSAMALAGPLAAVVKALHPFIWLMNQIANVILRLMRVEPKNEVTSSFTRDEVAGLVAESRTEGLIAHGEERLIIGALSFAERTAAGVLLPLAEVLAVPFRGDAEAVEQLAARTGYSRFPVLDHADGFLGYVQIKDVLALPEAERSRPVHETALRVMPAVRESDSLRAVLEALQSSAAHLAVVLDDGRVRRGVVALEDVIEELVGQIRDESRQAAG